MNRLSAIASRIWRRYRAFSNRTQLIIAGVVAFVVLGVGLNAAGSEEEPAEPAPTSTRSPAAPTTSPITTPAADPISLNHAVLGGPRPAWIAQRGDPEKGVVGDQFDADAPLAWVEAAFRDDGAGLQRAWMVEFQTERGSDLELTRARQLAKELVPSDATAVDTYVDRNGATVEVFVSVALAEAWSKSGRDPWGGEAPGTFIVVAERGQPTTSRVVIAVGNNP